MFLISDWKEDDGHHECILSFFYAHSAVPFIRVRAVLDGEGDYTAVIREYSGNGALIERGYPQHTLEEAKADAKLQAVKLIRKDVESLTELLEEPQ